MDVTSHSTYRNSKRRVFQRCKINTNYIIAFLCKEYWYKTLSSSLQVIFQLFVTLVRIDNTAIVIMSYYNIATSIVLETVIAILYVIGLYLNIKILIVSRKEKSMTWKIDFAHSIILIVLFTYNPLIHSLTFYVQDIYLVTGTSFCYVAKVVSHFLIVYVGAHSMIIAALKYIVIVYGEKLDRFK